MSPHTTSEHTAPRGLVIAAFAAVYIIWGSTYLAIRIAVDTIPPFFMAGLRFMIAGAVLYAVMRFRGVPNPNRSHWKNALIVGGLLLGGGNGGVCWAEQRVASSLAALMIAMVPLWIALFDWLRPGGARPRLQTVLGIAIGFSGMILLVGNPMKHTHVGLDLVGMFALVGAGVTWAFGSIYARYTPKPAAPLMGIAAQMIAGGGVLVLMGLIAGEPLRWDLSATSTSSIQALVYLIVIGSLIGFVAYSWLLTASTPARVSTYAYVNPVIAVLLGWVVLDETLTAHMLLGAAVIVLGVVVITTRRPLNV